MTNDSEFIQDKNIQVIYVDTFRIGYDAYKFVLDLGSIPPGSKTAHFKTRVIIGPDNLMDFIEILGQSVKEYKERFSSIYKID